MYTKYDRKKKYYHIQLNLKINKKIIIEIIKLIILSFLISSIIKILSLPRLPVWLTFGLPDLVIGDIICIGIMAIISILVVQFYPKTKQFYMITPMVLSFLFGIITINDVMKLDSESMGMTYINDMITRNIILSIVCFIITVVICKLYFIIIKNRIEQ